eukprot:2332571-Prymnesium_polylepis.2
MIPIPPTHTYGSLFRLDGSGGARLHTALQVLQVLQKKAPSGTLWALPTLLLTRMSLSRLDLSTRDS